MNAFKPLLKQRLKLLFAPETSAPEIIKYRYGEGYPEVEVNLKTQTIRVSMKELLRSEKAIEQTEAVQAMVDRTVKERERWKKSQAGGRGGRLGRKSQTGEGSGRLGRKNQARKPISKH